MADLKISALTSASTPLAGTEVLPIVQSGTTKKATVDNVTNRAIGPTSVAIGTALDGSLQSIGLAGATDGTTYVLNKWTPSTAEPTTYDLKFTTRFAGAGATAGWQYDFISRDFYTGSKTYLRFLGGNTVLPDGNLVIGTSGKGIDFSATAGTGTSELLSDYEEGNWTPTLTFGGASVGMTYSSQQAWYTKIGRTVNATCLIGLSAKGSSSGYAFIEGFPFVNSTQYPAASIRLNAVTSLGLAAVNMGASDAKALFTTTNAAGVLTLMDETYFSNTSQIMMTITYSV